MESVLVGPHRFFCFFSITVAGIFESQATAACLQLGNEAFLKFQLATHFYCDNLEPMQPPCPVKLIWDDLTVLPLVERP